MGVQKESLYAHIESKQDLLWEIASTGAAAFHEALDEVPERVSAVERIRLALRAHLRVVAEQLDVATVFTREWRYLSGSGGKPLWPSADATKSGSERSSARAASRASLRSDLDEGAAALLFLSAANWAYTWLQAGRDTEELADRFFRLLVDGMRGYSTPA